VKIYVVAVEGLRKKESRVKTWWISVETQLKHKKWCISEFDPPLKANVLFCRSFFESHPVLNQTQGSSGTMLSWLCGKL
jgi:hypothetical protein